MNTIRFKNLDRSIFQTGETKEEQELREYIEREYSERAAEVGAEFKKNLAEIMETCNPAYTGTQVDDLMRRTPSLAYIKCDTYDIQIDLLLHTFMRCDH